MEWKGSPNLCVICFQRWVCPRDQEATYKRTKVVLKQKGERASELKEANFKKNSSTLRMKIKQSTTWQEIQTFGKIPTSLVSTTTLCRPTRFRQRQKMLENQQFLPSSLAGPITDSSCLVDEIFHHVAHFFVSTCKKNHLQDNMVAGCRMVIRHTAMVERFKTFSMAVCFTGPRKQRRMEKFTPYFPNTFSAA
jgi:hypothetical protein